MRWLKKTLKFIKRNLEGGLGGWLDWPYCELCFKRYCPSRHNNPGLDFEDSNCHYTVCNDCFYKQRHWMSRKVKSFQVKRDVDWNVSVVPPGIVMPIAMFVELEDEYDLISLWSYCIEYPLKAFLKRGPKKMGQFVSSRMLKLLQRGFDYPEEDGSHWREEPVEVPPELVKEIKEEFVKVCEEIPPPDKRGSSKCLGTYTLIQRGKDDQEPDSHTPRSRVRP